MRLGTPALTTRGMKEKEMNLIAGWINDAVEHRGAPKRLAEIHRAVRGLCKKFPLYAHRLKMK